MPHEPLYLVYNKKVQNKRRTETQHISHLLLYQVDIFQRYTTVRSKRRVCLEFQRFEEQVDQS